MNTLYIMQGLPGSGKSTKAKELSEGLNSNGELKVVRVSKDLLREMFYWGGYSKDKEEAIKSTEEKIAFDFLSYGYSVIVDDTNLKDTDIAKWKTLADSADLSYEVITLDVSLEECIMRDSFRSHPVGEARIREMNELWNNSNNKLTKDNDKSESESES